MNPASLGTTDVNATAAAAAAGGGVATATANTGNVPVDDNGIVLWPNARPF